MADDVTPEAAPRMPDPTPFPDATARDLLAGVLDWQERHPDDPRLPEMLLAAIRRTVTAPTPTPDARAAAEATVKRWRGMLTRAFQKALDGDSRWSAAETALATSRIRTSGLPK